MGTYLVFSIDFYILKRSSVKHPEGKVKSKKAVYTRITVTVLSVLIFTACPLFEPKDTSPKHDYISISKDGGDYLFDNGFTLSIPEGAIPDDTKLYLENVKEADLSFFLEAREKTFDDILFAFDAGDMEFDSQVSVIIPVPDLQPGDIPFIQELDLETGTFHPAAISFIVDPVKGKIELLAEHFSTYSAEVVAELKKNDCAPPATVTCRCGRVKITQEDNYSGNNVCQSGTCQIISSKVSAQFLDCPNQPVEESIFEEVTPGCEVKMEVAADKTHIEPETTATVTATLSLGCGKLSGENVHLSITGPGTINTTDEVTGAEGTVSTVVTPNGEEGVITVTAAASVTYSTKKVTVNGVVQSNTEKTVDVSETVIIYVYKKPVMDLTAGSTSISMNDSTTITTTITRDGTPMSGQNVGFSRSGEGSLSSTSGTTDSSGTATTTLNAGSREGTAVVTATANVEVDLGGGNKVQAPLSEIVNVEINDDSGEYTLSIESDTTNILHWDSANVTVRILNNGTPVSNTYFEEAYPDTTFHWDPYIIIDFIPTDPDHSSGPSIDPEYWQTDTNGEIDITVTANAGSEGTITITAGYRYYDQQYNSVWATDALSIAVTGITEYWNGTASFDDNYDTVGECQNNNFAATSTTTFDFSFTLSSIYPYERDVQGSANASVSVSWYNPDYSYTKQDTVSGDSITFNITTSSGPENGFGDSCLLYFSAYPSYFFEYMWERTDPNYSGYFGWSKSTYEVNQIPLASGTYSGKLDEFPRLCDGVTYDYTIPYTVTLTKSN
jgi:hypothetical protein